MEGKGKGKGKAEGSLEPWDILSISELFNRCLSKSVG